MDVRVGSSWIYFHFSGVDGYLCAFLCSRKQFGAKATVKRIITMMFPSYFVPVLPLRIHMSVFSSCQFLKIFRNTLSFKLNADQSSIYTCLTGNFGFVFEKKKSGASCLDLVSVEGVNTFEVPQLVMCTCGWQD